MNRKFRDPQIESHYYNYYAQLKNNLLPTAIQVVLLVNLLQLSLAALFPPHSSHASLAIRVIIVCLTIFMLHVIKKHPRRTNLPYILWLCQLIQLASCLWPDRAFVIINSTLLLYSYTIYVIFPIRLMCCIILALGLSLSQPIVYYSLPLNSITSTYPSPPPPPTAPVIGLGGGGGGGGMNPNNYSIGYDNTDGSTSSNTGSDKPTTTTSTSNGTITQQDNLLLFSDDLHNSSQLAKLLTFIVLSIIINLIGILSFIFYERQQRAAFIETRTSLETKLQLEQESQEQERLLLSILPKHLAAEIRQDLGSVVGGPWKKIYMNRHDNVSILFADIVGFTAISSNCPAPELVKMLNELFARFDKLAEKYHQLRIKILGDCYYAISGAPIERSDHAVLCVHMGLSMVEAIKSVREKTKSTVDMRVGIHTGAVLAGVLGQRQWQFDVYSKDVELASKMESSGMPGRVHISDATLRFLDDEFEVVAADQTARDEVLKMANIKTYFITGVKKPYPEGTNDAGKDPLARSSQDSGSQPSLRRSTTSTTATATATATTTQTVATTRKAATVATTTNPANTSTAITIVDSDDHTEQHDPATSKQRFDSFELENRFRTFGLNLSKSQFHSISDIASCVTLIGLPVTIMGAFLCYIYSYRAKWKEMLLFASDFLVSLYLIYRQFQLTNKRLFLWRKQIEERKEQVADIRQKNEALVYNILPPNVAKIFLGKRNINDEELYSKSYEAVGVLFAAMPNFSDFYTEESVNNQGLECLRFLNEVISDYDALLSQDRFTKIIKIKTMGSTYMAASGLYEGDALEEEAAAASASAPRAIEAGAGAGEVAGESSKANEGGGGGGGAGAGTPASAPGSPEDIRAKWGHLKQLTEFALALKDTLNNINKESFNNFVLRIGINHGPITAGVIGVKKPHFDMWGNTVNVASRMESTGRAGSIQVVEETSHILRQFGYDFEQRGLVAVKGKGQLMTFYLTGRSAT